LKEKHRTKQKGHENSSVTADPFHTMAVEQMG
jgi:hypothetical protein